MGHVKTVQCWYLLNPFLPEEKGVEGDLVWQGVKGMKIFLLRNREKNALRLNVEVCIQFHIWTRGHWTRAIS